MGCAQHCAVSSQAKWQLWTLMQSTNTYSLISRLSSSTTHHWLSNLSSSAKTTASSSLRPPAYSGRASQISSRYNLLEQHRREPAPCSFLCPRIFCAPELSVCTPEPSMCLHGSARESTGKKDCYKSKCEFEEGRGFWV